MFTAVKAAPADVDATAARLDGAGYEATEESDGGRGLPEDGRDGLTRQARAAITAAPVPPDVEAASATPNPGKSWWPPPLNPAGRRFS